MRHFHFVVHKESPYNFVSLSKVHICIVYWLFKGLCLKNKFDYSVINSFSNKIAFPSPDFQTVSVLISLIDMHEKTVSLK